MRVCYVVSTFPRFEGDPEVPWLPEMVRRLREKNIDVEIFAPSYQGIASHHISGIPVHRFRYFFKRWEFLTHNEGATNKIQRTPLYNLLAIFYILFGSLAMLRLCASRRYDLFQAHWVFPHALFAWIGARLQKAGLCLRYYGAELMLADRFPPAKPFLRFFMKRADAVDAISTFTASRAKAIHDREIAIIPYGSPVEISPDGAPAGAPLSQKQILYVGRLIERKGVEYLVRAMPLVREQGVDARLTVVGAGHRETEIRQAIRQSGAEDWVAMAGRVSEEEKVRLYSTCDLFVLPAIVDSGGDTEMLGVVFLEAMTYRKPVIGSDVGGIPDVIKDEETGLLVPQKDPEALAEAIVRVLTDSELARKLGEQGHVFSRGFFSWDRITDSLIDEYRAASPRRKHDLESVC